MSDHSLDDLKDELSRLLGEIIARAKQEGAAMARDSILKAATSFVGGHGVAAPTMATGADVVIARQRPKPVRQKFTRAPKGLADEVIGTVLGSAEGGLTLIEVQGQAAFLDSRVPAKTVYNKLHSNPQGAYVNRDGRWYLAETPDKQSAGVPSTTTPAEQFTLQPERR